MFRTINEIINAVDANKTVYWKNPNYIVKKTSLGYNIHCLENNHIGFPLLKSENVLNGEIWDYYFATDKDHIEEKIALMQDEINYLREKLRNTNDKNWEPPHKYLEIK